MRDRLIDLLYDVQDARIDTIADHLIANGVIVPPCKVGDTVWVVFSQFRNEISECRINEFSTQKDRMYAVVDIHYPNFVAERNTSIPFNWFGRFAFLTREEAEQALNRKGKK